MTGQLEDTYVAALQHDMVDLPAGVTLVGVVRRPTPWFYAAVDENVPALAPPADLLDEGKRHHEQLAATGLDDAEAHNRAFEAADYESRYRDHLETAEAQGAVADLLDRLADGEDLALVCYENTETKRCHRTILASYLRERMDSGHGRDGGERRRGP